MAGSSDHSEPQDTGAAQLGSRRMAPRSEDAVVETTHELANLITVVLGSLEQLRRQPLDDKGQQQLGRAEWGALRVARLTRQVLSQARGEDGTAEITDLNAVADDFAMVMAGRVDSGVQVAVELTPGPLPVRLDSGLLNLVLRNLVRGLTDGMPGGGEVVLRTRGPRLDGLGAQLTTEVSVSDGGTGMSADVALHATEELFATKPVGKGTGLGLWMARRFASDCGGTVKIETVLGQGTTVRLVFPYAGQVAPR